MSKAEIIRKIKRLIRESEQIYSDVETLGDEMEDLGLSVLCSTSHMIDEITSRINDISDDLIATKNVLLKGKKCPRKK